MGLRFDDATRALEASLDLRLQRQDLLTANLVNADTPNYQAADLGFEGFLTAAESPQDVTGADASNVLRKAEGAVTKDGNGVDLDTQVAKLAENATRYDTALELTRRKLALMRYAVGMGQP